MPRTKSQRLATTYNYMIFRVSGFDIPLCNRKIPHDLHDALYHFRRSKNLLLDALQNPEVREEFMRLNEE